MPTVLREDGFEVMIYTDDHEPPHVHVFYGGEDIIIGLEDADVRWARPSTKNSVVRKARKLIIKHHDFLMQKWGEMRN